MSSYIQQKSSYHNIIIRHLYEIATTVASLQQQQRNLVADNQAPSKL